MKKKNLDWKNLPFSYIKTDYRFIAEFKNGKWDEGKLIKDNEIHLHEGSGSLHYAQQCFEGLKAYTSPENKILLFRPSENAKRMEKTAKRLLMPPVSTDFFISAIEKTVLANSSWIPPFGNDAALYIRPILFGTGEMLGLVPAPEFQFRIFVSPVGAYFTKSKKDYINLYLTDEFDRVAPKGIGSFKAGANYIAGFLAKKKAVEKGADEVLYLDSKHHRFLDESGAANIIIVTKDNKIITPKSDSILPSIIRLSAIQLAADKLGLKTEQREIDFLDEVANFQEMGACGTAAVIVPIGKIISEQKNYFFDTKTPVIKKLYKMLTEIQQGKSADPYNWVHQVKKTLKKK